VRQADHRPIEGSSGAPHVPLSTELTTKTCSRPVLNGACAPATGGGGTRSAAGVREPHRDLRDRRANFRPVPDRAALATRIAG
jgi:hypothetical protein